MSNRSFTLNEAQTLLPILESLLRSAIDGKKLIETVDEEFQDLSHRILLNGGMHLDIVHWARRKAEREKAIQRIKDALGEIDATGVQVKDLDIGLLDFPLPGRGPHRAALLEAGRSWNHPLARHRRRLFRTEAD